MLPASSNSTEAPMPSISPPPAALSLGLKAMDRQLSDLIAQFSALHAVQQSAALQPPACSDLLSCALAGPAVYPPRRGGGTARLDALEQDPLDAIRLSEYEVSAVSGGCARLIYLAMQLRARRRSSAGPSASWR